MPKKPDPKLGEPRRTFLKHKAFGTLYAVDLDLAGDVLGAVVVTDGLACRHTAKTYWLQLDDVDEINHNLGDYDEFEPVCCAPLHLLQDIGDQMKAVAIAEGAWNIARNQAKALKETYDAEKATLFAVVRRATEPPKPLPLFDTKAEDASEPAPDGPTGGEAAGGELEPPQPSA